MERHSRTAAPTRPLVMGMRRSGRVGVAEAPGVAGDERFAFLVEQHDGEHLVVDEAAQELADALQQGVEVEDGGQLDGDLVEHFEGLRLARDAGVEAGVLNGLGDARGGEGEHVQVLGAEVVGLLALQVHDADEAVFGDQRDGQLGADVGIGGDVVLGGGDVVEQDGLAGKRHLADDALADGNAHPLNFRGVADLEAHAQFVGAVVEQQDGEDAVMDDGAHQLRGAVEQGLQVERGVQRVGQLHQIGDVGRLNAGVDGVKMRRGIWRGDSRLQARVVQAEMEEKKPYLSKRMITQL